MDFSNCTFTFWDWIGVGIIAYLIAVALLLAFLEGAVGGDDDDDEPG